MHFLVIIIIIIIIIINIFYLTNISDTIFAPFSLFI